MGNKKSVNILFLGGAKRLSLGERFLRAGDELNANVNIFSYELDKYVPISAIATNVIVGLRWDDQRIIEHLLTTIREYSIHIVLPFVDPATTVSAKLKAVGENIFAPVSDESVCETFFDKIRANRWFVENRIPVPESTNEFPLIAKLRKGSASKGIVIIRNTVEWRFFADSYNQENYLVQRFIEGDEYSIDCYISTKGEIMSVVSRKRIEIAEGEVTKSVTVRDNEIIELANKILIRCKCVGPLTMQVIREEKTGKLFVLEINPRFGGGVLVSIEAGANIPSMILKDYFGICNTPVSDWKENVLMARAYREVFHCANSG